MTHTLANNQPDRDRQIAAYLDGTLAPDDMPAFCDWLNADDTHARRLVDQMTLESHLRTSSIADRGARTAEVSAEGVPIYRKGHEPNPKPEFRIPKSAIAFSIAAALLAACGLAIFLFLLNPEPSPPEPSAKPLANLIENASEGTLTTPGGFISEGRDYPRGEYTLSTGTAEFMLTNAVNVKLRGETRLHMRNDMNVVLTRGSAEFVVPSGATGFTVNLPDGTKIIDRGTAFTVSVDDANRSEVRVTEGRVEWVSASPDTAPLQLVAGQHARSVDGRTTVTDSLPIANWKDFDGAGANTSLNTDSPTFGGTGDYAGRFGAAASPQSITLGVGQTLTVTGSVTLTGGVNAPTLRFGLFNDGGRFETADTNWASGYLHKTAIPGEKLPGLYQARTDGFFLSTNKNAIHTVSDFDITAGSWDTDSTAPFEFSFAVTRDSEATLSLVSTISGGDGNLVETISETLAPPNTDHFTYTVFGLLCSDTTGIERIDLSNVRYVVTPPRHANTSNDQAKSRPAETPTDE